MSKLVKNRKLNYAHTRKSLPDASSKELVLVFGKVNLRDKFDFKNRAINGSAIVDTSLNRKKFDAFNTSGVIGHRN